VTRPRTGFPFLDAGLDQPGSVLAFAHRGGAFHPGLEGLENTVAAFEHAVALGYRYLETDVHATKDGVVLAFHDEALDRVTEHRGRVQEMTLADVTRALIGGRESIPTLEALLEHFPEVCFNIDIKSGAAIAPLADLVETMKAHDRVCVASFSQRRLRAFRGLAGDRVATSAGPVEVARVRFSPHALSRVLARTAAAALQVPQRTGPVQVVTPGLVARAHALGKQVHVWTVDDPLEMHTLLDLGVDGLISDRTDLLREVLTERGQWMGATP
jgi:glycerophosphoryl diester phosphodiesterase